MNGTTIIFEAEEYLRRIENIAGPTNVIPAGIYKLGRRVPYTNADKLTLYPSGEAHLIEDGLPIGENCSIIDDTGNTVVGTYELNNDVTTISTTPFHAYNAVRVLGLIINNIQYNNNPNKELLLIDAVSGIEEPLIDPSVLDHIYLEDIIASVFKGIDTKQLVDIVDIYHKNILPMIQPYMEMHSQSLFSFNHDSINLKLTRIDDVRALRYEALMAGKKEK